MPWVERTHRARQHVQGKHPQQLTAGGLHAGLVRLVPREADHLLAQARLVQDARLPRARAEPP